MKNIDAIVYTSNAGHTKEYAELLSEKTGIKAYSLDAAKSAVAKGSKVLYMGWLMAGNVKGFKDATKLYEIVAVCGVGMAKTGSQIEDIRKANSVPDGTPVFSLQGGFDMKKLSGVYKVMMGTMKKTLGKSLANKADKTPEEEEMLALLMYGGNRVSAANLIGLIKWIDNVE